MILENEIANPNMIAASYKKVIAAFKNRFDVQNGKALGYRKNQDPKGALTFENTPKGIGDGLSTTGWCVSASQAFLLDNVFQVLLIDRKAFAKLISIDIKEQHYGRTYTGNQNKWHTAILVQDSNINLVIDLTCAQFGNNYVGKDIWDFKTWESTFRSSQDSHTIVGFDGRELTNIEIAPNLVDKDVRIDNISIKKGLYDITTITDNERNVLANFFGKNISVLNSKLEIGNINKFDYKYLDTINSSIKNLNYTESDDNRKYFVKYFPSKEVFKIWLKRFIDEGSISKQFMMLSNTLSDACAYSNIMECDLKLPEHKSKGEIYVVFEFETSISGFDTPFVKYTSMVIPYGIKLDIKFENIKNSCDLVDNTGRIPEKSNTIYIKI